MKFADFFGFELTKIYLIGINVSNFELNHSTLFSVYHPPPSFRPRFREDPRGRGVCLLFLPRTGRRVHQLWEGRILKKIIAWTVARTSNCLNFEIFLPECRQIPQCLNLEKMLSEIWKYCLNFGKYCRNFVPKAYQNIIYWFLIFFTIGYFQCQCGFAWKFVLSNLWLFLRKLRF